MFAVSLQKISSSYIIFKVFLFFDPYYVNSLLRFLCVTPHCSLDDAVCVQHNKETFFIII